MKNKVIILSVVGLAILLVGGALVYYFSSQVGTTPTLLKQRPKQVCGIYIYNSYTTDYAEICVFGLVRNQTMTVTYFTVSDYYLSDDVFYGIDPNNPTEEQINDVYGDSMHEAYDTIQNQLGVSDVQLATGVASMLFNPQYAQSNSNMIRKKDDKEKNQRLKLSPIQALNRISRIQSSSDKKKSGFYFKFSAESTAADINEQGFADAAKLKSEVGSEF